MDKDKFYIGEDGLEYCAVCQEPVEKYLSENVQKVFHMKTHPRQCACVRAQMEKEKQERKEREHQQEVEKNTAICFPESAMREWNFASDDGSNPHMRYAKQYVEHWDEVKKKGMGMLLWGDVGTGKSFAAACIANALLEQAIPVLMTNFSKILNQMGAMYSEERYQYIASFNHYSLLIIDDLGIERSTEYAKEQVYAVIDERYKANLPLIITTNLTISEIRNPDNVADARIYSRVLEMCTPVQVGGSDRRRTVSRGKQEMVKDVLFSGKGGETI